jgi:hypothetical protein
MERTFDALSAIVRLTYALAMPAAIAAILAGCGKSSTADATAAVTSNASIDAGSPSTTPASAKAADTATAGNTVSGRELLNPDASTVVFLFYRLALLQLPLDTWVEEDTRVKFAPPLEKAAKREAVRSELNAAAASVQGVGALRLTMNANLSDYDPSYGEFTVRALSPSSVVSFDALGQKVAVSFTNGRTAQIWRVPQGEAQGVRDKISSSSSVEIDVLLRIANVLPGPGGGTIATEVVQYELRETQRGAVLARVQLEDKK